MDSSEELDAVPHLRFCVASEDGGQRLDVYLSARHRDLSRNGFRKLIAEGRVLVSGRRTKPAYEVRGGDEIAVWLPDAAYLQSLRPQAMSLAVLYEDFHILVINKAPGLVVHPGAGHTEGTLVHGLLAHCPNLALQGAPLRPGIVHRLDKDTSGVLVVAKTERAYLNLVRQFQEREVRKEYLALVFGAALPIRGEIRTQLGRHPAERKKIAVTRSGTGREAITCWQVERVWGSEVSLLRVRIETGRTHQIRVHLSHLRHPVIGDPVYGGKRRLESLQDKEMRRVLKPVRRQLLHACTLALRHPETGSLHVFQAPLASDFAAVLEALDRYQGAQPKR